MLTRLILRLYPKRFRERYGEEIADLLEHSRRPMRDLGNVLWSALAASRWWLRGWVWARCRRPAQLGTLAILYGGQTATAYWMLSANYGNDAPFRHFVPMVLLNPALALALTYAHAAAYAAKTRTAPASVGTLEG